MHSSLPIRTACPPGACACGRETLLADPRADQRVLLLTKAEENKLVERLESVETLAELRRMQVRMQDLLGLVVRIAPGPNEVHTMRGFEIRIEDMPGLCSKTRQAIPAAIRRGLQRRPEIAYALLNERDLLADA
ncbi:hypothetical protein [Bordetella sp. FB-8]|uniref:hypothetical protein n=1 Tax=Bordetella sp. FB-8 TaxID=1159870 RepID=UPI00037483AF|nr:hypothetical protein [Bordetella sp. FB-8]